jgi:hypothetical protein
MKWYSARIVSQCFVNGKQSRAKQYLFDESVIVIRALNPAIAYNKALQFGKKQNVKYKNSRGENVNWRFCGLADLDEILSNSIKDGTEISSQRKLMSNKQSLIVPKNKLSVFWAQRNNTKKASNILER